MLKFLFLYSLAFITSSLAAATGHFPPEHQKRAVEPADGQATVVSMGEKINLNPTEITNAVKNAIVASTDRGAMVQNVLGALKNVGNKQEENVLIFNLQQKFRWIKEPDAASTAIGQLKFQNIVYQFWIFRSAAHFENQGDGGWINWGFNAISSNSNKEVQFLNKGTTVTTNDVTSNDVTTKEDLKSQNGTSNSNSGGKIGAIVGGCIGGVLVVAGSVFGYRKYRNRNSGRIDAKTHWENLMRTATIYFY